VRRRVCSLSNMGIDSFFKFSNEGIQAAMIPFLAPSLVPNTPLDWNYTTTPQPGYNNRVIPYPRGRLLGGSTSVSASPLVLVSLPRTILNLVSQII
jgi:choline dehydrogenase-like flavoprotein